MLVVTVAPTGGGSGMKLYGLMSAAKAVTVAHAAPPPDQKPRRSPPRTTIFAENVFNTFGVSACKGDSAITLYVSGTPVGRRIIKLIDPPELPANGSQDVR